MSIRLQFAGVQLECETPEEAVALTRLLIAPVSLNGHCVSPSASVSPSLSISSVVRRLGPKQKRALGVILQAGGRANDAQLRKELDVEGSGLGGLMAAITKEAKRSGLDPAKLFSSRAFLNSSKTRVREYALPRESLDQIREGLRE